MTSLAGSPPATEQSGDARPVWLHLLALLHHSLAECDSPDARRRFGHLGSGTHKIAARLLRREIGQVVAAMRQRGWHVDTEAIARGAATLPLRDDIVDDFEKLAQAFDRSAALAALADDMAWSQWLAGRARLHRQHGGLLD
jgi:hypothetical protein